MLNADPPTTRRLVRAIMPSSAQEIPMSAIPSLSTAAAPR